MNYNIPFSLFFWIVSKGNNKFYKKLFNLFIEIFYILPKKKYMKLINLIINDRCI